MDSDDDVPARFRANQQQSSLGTLALTGRVQHGFWAAAGAVVSPIACRCAEFFATLTGYVVRTFVAKRRRPGVDTVGLWKGIAAMPLQRWGCREGSICRPCSS